MSIATIEHYVEQKNRWRAIFGEPELSLLGANDRKIIAEFIDGELSPENLTCDGELSRSQVQAKYNYLTRCAQELLSIDPTVRIYELN